MNCLECGDSILGRADKKFCNDACRNAYNNKQNSLLLQTVSPINAILKRNYKILLELDFVENKCKIDRATLTKKGFNFGYITQIKTYKNGAQYYFVYNIGYKFLEDDRLLIVKND